jgi:hypothetical protein
MPPLLHEFYDLQALKNKLYYLEVINTTKAQFTMVLKPSPVSMGQEMPQHDGFLRIIHII